MRAPQKTLTSIIAVGAALLLALTACSSPSPKAAPATTTPTPTPTATEKPCSGLTGDEALKKWANEVETTRPWDLSGKYSDVTGYDECAEISWIVLRPEECCTVFEITPIMFFHRGEFVSEATITDRAQDRQTAAERLSDSEISLTFATPGGANQPPELTTTKYAWDEDSESIVATEAAPETPTPTAGNANGHWCPTPESNDQYGCVTITLPNAKYDSGDALELIDRGDQNGDGSTTYIGPGAPFGTFYPAGTPIHLPDYYPGSDLPDQDRIWNGQTGSLLIRD